VEMRVARAGRELELRLLRIVVIRRLGLGHDASALYGQTPLGPLDQTLIIRL
jgi:hypothetical protein